MKQLNTLIICLLLSTGLIGQGTTACGAAALVTGTTSVLTDTGTSTGGFGGTPSCGSYMDASGCVNGWFCYTNTSSVPIVLDIDATSILGTDRDVTLVIYSSSDNTCTGTFTEEDCENEGTNGDGTIDVMTTVAPGEKVWIRMFDFNCDADVQLDITTINETPATNFGINEVDGQDIMLDCTTKNTVLYTITDDNAAGDYTDFNTTQTVTFTAAPGCQVWIKEYAPQSGVGGGAFGDAQICAATNVSASTDCENSDINDYLKIYDGTNLVNNVIGISMSVPRRFGNYKSANGSITLEWITGATGMGNGWEIDVYCSPAPTVNPTVVVPCSGTPSTNFTDPGGAGGTYGNDAHQIWTFCPAAGCADVVCVDLGLLDIEEYYDALYVFDGMDTNAPLHSTFQGANNSATGIIRAMPSNASGCLTFMFLSDMGTDLNGWNSDIFTCPTIGPNGGETCAMATDISGGGTYHNNTYQATGTPNQGGAGMADPAISDGSPVTNGTCYPTQTTTSDVTQLESTVWYTFTTPNAICGIAPPVSLGVSNVSCVVSGGASSSGAQFVLYETPTCQTAADWQSMQIFCSDLIASGSTANFSGITFMPNTTYYLMVDAFAGRNCELDLTLDIQIPDDMGGCMSVPVELSAFYARDENCTVELLWKTESERNSSHFDVLKSTNGFDYERIGTVQSAGTSIESIQYSFVDKNPEALNYYRLRQVDVDGTEEYSRIITVKPSSCGKGELDITRIYPNPSNDWITIDLNLPTASIGQLLISNMSGKRMLQKNYELEAGTQSIQIPVYEFAAGFYTLQFVTEDGSFARPRRFVVQ